MLPTNQMGKPYDLDNLASSAKWLKRFSDGRESVSDEERSGRPARSRNEEKMAKVRQIVRENRRLSGA